MPLTYGMPDVNEIQNPNCGRLAETALHSERKPVRTPAT